MPIAFRGDPHSVRSEAYRQLRTNLQFVNVDHAPRIIAVTSAIPGEGKTTTALNLAAALAEAGHRVCLIEADLRRPTIAKTLGLVADVGFTTVLIGQSTVEAALQNVGRNFAVLTSGPVPPNPSELLISEQARHVIEAVIAQTDYTIIDTAPLLPVTDGAEVAALADATVVVHRAGKTTRDQAGRSVGGAGEGRRASGGRRAQHGVARHRALRLRVRLLLHVPAEPWRARQGRRRSVGRPRPAARRGRAGARRRGQRADDGVDALRTRPAPRCPTARRGRCVGVGSARSES